MKHKLIILSLIMYSVMVGCSSIKSYSTTEKSYKSGMIYFLPKRDFIVTVVVENSKIKSVSAGVSDAYPDLDEKYVLEYRTNWVGKNTLDIVVTENGLLSSASSKSVSGLEEALVDIGSITGTVGVLEAFPSDAETQTKCIGNRTYTFKIDISLDSSSSSLCGLTVDIDRTNSTDAREGNDIGSIASKIRNTSGVYYRTNLPYQVEIGGTGFAMDTIVHSPTGSPTRFLPVSRTLFSDNEANLVFVDGVLTKYKQDADGEVVALLKIPAKVIAAYFSAVGKVFDSFSSTDQKESASLSNNLKLEIDKQKYKKCVEALQKNDMEKFDELKCE